MLISTRHRSSLLLVATLAVVAVVPIWQAAADITRQIDATSNTSPSHININDETHHDDTPSWSSGGIRGLRKKKKKKNSMSRSKSHKSAKRPKAKEKKKNVFGNKDTTEEDDNNTGTFVGDEKEEEDNSTVVGDDEEEVIITCNGCATCTDAILGATATATNDEGESESYTCKERIQLLMTSKGGSMSENAACTQVGEKFPTICGSCTPCCTLEQQVQAACETTYDGNPCTTKTCIADDYFGYYCVPKKDTDGKLLPPPQNVYSCQPPDNPCVLGTCDDGECIGNAQPDGEVGYCDTSNRAHCCNGACCPYDKPICSGGECFEACSMEQVDACELDPCSTNICIVMFGKPLCEPKADGTPCSTGPCKEEGTCSDGVCSGGSDLQQGTKDKCGTGSFDFPDTPVQCCNGGCCPKDKPFCCRYLLTNDYTW